MVLAATLVLAVIGSPTAADGSRILVLREGRLTAGFAAATLAEAQA
jgi:hypothetical protein